MPQTHASWLTVPRCSRWSCPPLFLVWHRLWWPLVLYVLATILLMVIGAAVSEGLSAALGILPGLFLFVHGRELVRGNLLARGWREAAAIAADDAGEAELRFYMGRAGSAAAPRRFRRALAAERYRRRRGRKPVRSEFFRNEGRDHRLRVGQSALGPQGLRARRARGGIAARDRPDRRGRARAPPPTASCCRASAPLPTAAPASTPCPAWSRRSQESVIETRPAVPRHLRRHAADGGARAGKDRHRRASAGSRATCVEIDARRSGAQDPADRLEHARRVARRIRCSTASRPGRTGWHAYFVHSYHLVAEGPGAPRRHHRLWRAGHGDRRPRQHGRHAVPPRKEPDARPRAHRQFPAGGSR